MTGVRAFYIKEVDHRRNSLCSRHDTCAESVSYLLEESAVRLHLILLSQDLPGTEALLVAVHLNNPEEHLLQSLDLFTLEHDVHRPRGVDASVGDSGVIFGDWPGLDPPGGLALLPRSL